MSHDEIIRTVAVVAAAALLAAPYRQQIARLVSEATEAAKRHGSTIGRIAAAVLIVAAAWGKIPLPSLPMTPAAPVWPSCTSYLTCWKRSSASSWASPSLRG